jgi:hypothetical protein
VKDRLSSLLNRSKPVQIETHQDKRELDDDQKIERELERDTDRGNSHSL